MAKFKQIREAAKYNPYAIGMAAAKKAAGLGKAPAHDLPKSIITKGHEIAKKIKANEEFDGVLEGMLKPELEKGFPAAGVRTGAAAPKGKANTMPKDKKKAAGQPAGAMGEETESLDELKQATLLSYAHKAGNSALKMHQKAQKMDGRKDRFGKWAMNQKALTRLANYNLAIKKVTKKQRAGDK